MKVNSTKICKEYFSKFHFYFNLYESVGKKSDAQWKATKIATCPELTS